MIVAALIALLGLAIVAVSARPGDGRAETAIAVPLVAAVAVLVPVAAAVLLAGAALAYGVLAVVTSRTLLYGRRLRAIAAVAGAVVPLGALAANTALGSPPGYPELLIVGAVVPGVLADDVRRQPRDRRGPIAIGGIATLLALALSGLVLRGSLAGAELSSIVDADAGSTLGAGSLAVLGGVLLLAVVTATLLRWRYAIGVGPISIPLVAVWSIDGVAVPVTYLLAALASTIAIAAVQPRLCLPGRQLSATVGLLGATVGVIAALAGAPGLPAILAGTFAAEDARLLRHHAGADLLDAVALDGAGYVLVVVALFAAAGGAGVLPGVLGGVGAVLAIVTIGTVLARRERERPVEERLRAAEGRWVP
ncbi:hypothetical protein L593_07990 [Salinarchaeum sp. Harcht-Bsk1]|uniref:poly-gamma-glutamate biosynthesis protein PgsC/CapC n=1 Tax=Salinarchaeum sp. Harcht-Bsk1 TaxID=1333523 RepID=UPI0003423E4F|nr:poly-gamma-glutamate biosynthesis protein PgsC/CapC [Salinarchaeum sp. Harcht-Bsk1]AGN01543.1 hypothetical protein L593_07990 [Salinarchaeum sp. Harcht-Bsk1]